MSTRTGPNLIDLVVGYFDPSRGLTRARHRALMTRAYEGALTTDGWRPRRSGASANADHRGDATTLRIRARALVQNTPYMARGLASLTSNVIGTGITPRSLAKQEATRLSIDRIWAEWVKVADADGRLSFYGLQASAYRAMKQDGEVLIRLRQRKLEDKLPAPLQIQVLEIDWLDSSRNGTQNGNSIFNGIEYDMLGRVAAYWLFDQHPGEMAVFARSGGASKRVLAESIIHLYNPDRPGQGRGITALAPVIARVRDLQTYEDAELQRKNLETRLSVLVSGDASMLVNGEGPPPITAAGDQANAKSTGSLGTLPSGGITELPGGVNITTLEPKAADGYVEYVKFQLHLISAGFGSTYEMTTGDVSETNFSSARVRLQDFRRDCESEQWLVVIPNLCDKVWRAVMQAAELAGLLREPDFAVDWSTPKWDYVNPEQDVKADLAEISGGLSSISEKLRRRGYVPELVFAEIKKDFDRLQADGTLEVLLALQGRNQPTGGQPPAGSAKKGERSAAADDAEDPAHRAHAPGSR